MHKVTIGDATLYLGDCMDILPTLGKVDADAFALSCKRIEQAVAQGQLFKPEPVKQVQEALL